MRKAITRLVLVLMALTTFATTATRAQDSLEVTIGADLVSRYVWRGMDQGSGPSIQPTFGLSYKGLSLSAWGSGSISKIEVEEIDLCLAYSAGRFSVSLTDYFIEGSDAAYGDFVNDHCMELNLSYCISEKAPLTIGWNTMLFAGKKYELNADGDRMYSTYISLAYDFDVHGVGLTPTIGINPWKSQYYEKFGVLDITLTGTKSVKITDSFELPLMAQVTVSPALDRVHLVFGISF